MNRDFLPKFYPEHLINEFALDSVFRRPFQNKNKSRKVVKKKKAKVYPLIIEQLYCLYSIYQYQPFQYDEKTPIRPVFKEWLQLYGRCFQILFILKSFSFLKRKWRPLRRGSWILSALFGLGSGQIGPGNRTFRHQDVSDLDVSSPNASLDVLARTSMNLNIQI